LSKVFPRPRKNSRVACASSPCVPLGLSPELGGFCQYPTNRFLLPGPKNSSWFVHATHWILRTYFSSPPPPRSIPIYFVFEHSRPVLTLIVGPCFLWRGTSPDFTVFLICLRSLMWVREYPPLHKFPNCLPQLLFLVGLAGEVLIAAPFIPGDWIVSR